MEKISKLENEILMGKLLDCFEQNLIKKLNLTKLICPLIFSKEDNYNDELDGIMSSVGFKAGDIDIEISQSATKWKRKTIYEYGFEENHGLIADEVGIRKDENMDNVHSLIVRQWNWEKKLNSNSKNIEYLKECVNEIFGVIKKTERYLYELNSNYIPQLPEKISFITTEELLERFPDNTPEEREHLIAKQYGAVFIMKIGIVLKNGERHSRRAADYDDWNLNGDIVVDFPEINRSLELSSMGIRVDKEALISQLESVNENYKLDFKYHKDIINNVFPECIGGGIGQSRLLMYLMKRKHIGEVCASAWDNENKQIAKEQNLVLL